MYDVYRYMCVYIYVSETRIYICMCLYVLDICISVCTMYFLTVNDSYIAKVVETSGYQLVTY